MRNVRTNRADNKTDGRIADNITGGGNEQNEKDFVHTHAPCYSCELKRLTTIPGTGRGRLKALALETAALLRRERLGAVMTGRERQVSIDGEQRLLVGDCGDVVAVPRDVVLDILGIDAMWSGRQAIVRFHPDGASTGAVLKLSREKAEYEIRVNWYTGGVAIAP